MRFVLALGLAVVCAGCLPPNAVKPTHATSQGAVKPPVFDPGDFEQTWRWAQHVCDKLDLARGNTLAVSQHLADAKADVPKDARVRWRVSVALVEGKSEKAQVMLADRFRPVPAMEWLQARQNDIVMSPDGLGSYPSGTLPYYGLTVRAVEKDGSVNSYDGARFTVSPAGWLAHVRAGDLVGVEGSVSRVLWKKENLFYEVKFYLKDYAVTPLP